MVSFCRLAFIFAYVCVVAFNDGYLWVIAFDGNRVSGFYTTRPSDFAGLKYSHEFIRND